MSDTHRNYFLNDMDRFIENEYNWFLNASNYLEWNVHEEYLTNKSEFVSCSVCSEHRMPAETLDFHVVNCTKKYENYPSVADNFIADFTSSKIQDNESNIWVTCDSVSKQDSKTNEKLIKQPSSSTCLIELLTAERDAKRRRAAHRGKRVHSNKKSYSEILKEIIDNEMKSLEKCTESEIEEPSYASESTSEVTTKREFMYEGIGNLLYNKNPYKRWKTIHEEELHFTKNAKYDKNLIKDKEQYESTSGYCNNTNRYQTDYGSDPSINVRKTYDRNSVCSSSSGYKHLSKKERSKESNAGKKKSELSIDEYFRETHLVTSFHKRSKFREDSTYAEEKTKRSRLNKKIRSKNSEQVAGYQNTNERIKETKLKNRKHKDKLRKVDRKRSDRSESSNDEFDQDFHTEKRKSKKD